MDNTSMKSYFNITNSQGTICKTMMYHFPFVTMSVIKMMGEGRRGGYRQAALVQCKLQEYIVM